MSDEPLDTGAYTSGNPGIPAPAGADAPPPPERWKPPTGKQEWIVTEDLQGAPDWVDKNWTGFNGFKVPVGDYPFGQPYTTERAVQGDQIQWVPPTASRGGHFVVVKDADPELSNRRTAPRPAQQSAASLHDLVKTGAIPVDELSKSEKMGLIVTRPEYRDLVEGHVEQPEPPDLGVRATPME